MAVLFVAIFASEIGKAVSKETKIDILVTPLVTIGVGVALSAWWAPALGSAAMKVGNIIMWATNPVSYTHLDVYKRQIKDQRLEAHNDWKCSHHLLKNSYH